MRGILAMVDIPANLTGITPACAGNTLKKARQITILKKFFHQIPLTYKIQLQYAFYLFAKMRNYTLTEIKANYES